MDIKLSWVNHQYKKEQQCAGEKKKSYIDEKSKGKRSELHFPGSIVVKT